MPLELFAAFVSITTPPNGLSSPALPGNPINGTGSPNNTGVGGIVYYRIDDQHNYSIIDNFGAQIKGGGWTASVMSGVGVYTVSGEYRYVAYLMSYTGVSDTSNCTIP
jgi:hypothetical protein